MLLLSHEKTPQYYYERLYLYTLNLFYFNVNSIVNRSNNVFFLLLQIVLGLTPTRWSSLNHNRKYHQYHHNLNPYISPQFNIFIIFLSLYSIWKWCKDSVSSLSLIFSIYILYTAGKLIAFKSLRRR